MTELKQNRSLLPFQVGPYTFCAPADEVEAIIEMPEIRSVPFVQNSFEGVFDYRGKVAQVVNLKHKFGLEQKDQTKKGLIILTQLKSGLTGFCVDEVTEIVPPSDLNEFRLSSKSSITAFDGFIIKNEQILLNTSFDQLLKAEDSIPGPTPSEKKLKAIEINALSAEAQNEKLPEKIIEKSETPDEISEKNTGQALSTLPPSSSQSATNNKTRPAARKIRKPDRKKLFQAPQKAAKSDKNIHPAYKNYSLNSSARRSALQPHPGTRIGPYQTAIQNSSLKPSKRMLIAGSSAILFLPLLLIFMLRPDKNNLSADPAAAIPGYQMLIEKNVGKTPEPATFSEKKPSGTSSKPSPATKVKHTAPERTLKKTALNKGNGFFTPKKQIKPSEDNKAQSRLKIKKIGSTHSTFETDNFKIIVEHRKEEYQKEETPLLKELRGVNEIHTVVKGDTLWHIAILYLGDPLLYPAIAELSRINNPDLIYPGDKIYLIRK